MPFVGAIRVAAVLVYVAGLVGPCLSNCLAPASAATSHACCEEAAPGKALRAPGKDCCTIQDQAPTAATALHAVAPAPIAVPPLVAEGLPLARLQATVRTAAPPPPVLRI